VGNDNTMTAEGCVKGTQVKIQNHVFYLSTFLLLIARADLVLELLGWQHWDHML